MRWAAIPGGVSYPESWLGVPILAGDRVTGVIILESTERDAFVEADERLLSTLAASMGVALENARLFDETKRLLAETDQRAAELAIINGVQQGLAAELDLQAMYDLVGDKIQETFDAQVVDIAIADFGADIVNFVVRDRAGRPLSRRSATDHGDDPRIGDGNASARSGSIGIRSDSPPNTASNGTSKRARSGRSRPSGCHSLSAMSRAG